MPSASCSEKVAATFLCLRSCGFARVAALVLGRKVSAELFKEEKEGQAKFCARTLQEHYKRYTELFKAEEGSFRIDFAKFRKKLPQLRDFLKSWNPQQKVEKEKYVNHFSPESWNQLPPERKREHRFADCKGYQKRDAEIHTLFPVRSKQFKEKANIENIFSKSNNIKIPSVPLKCWQPYSQTDIKKIAKGLYDRVNLAFEKICKVLFATAMTKVPEIELQKKKSPNELCKARRDRDRKVKCNIEDAWKTDTLER